MTEKTNTHTHTHTNIQTKTNKHTCTHKRLAEPTFVYALNNLLDFCAGTSAGKTLTYSDVKIGEYYLTRPDKYQ